MAWDTDKMKDNHIESALKLQALVKKFLKESDLPNYADWTYHNLSRMVEESEK